MKEKITKIVKWVLFVTIALIGGLYLTAFVGAEFGAGWAVSIRDYIEAKWDIALGAGTAGALLMVVRYASNILGVTNNSSRTIGQASDTINAVGGAISQVSSKVEENVGRLETGLQALAGGLVTLDEYKNKISLIDGFDDKIKTITDILLVYVFKNSSDSTLNEIRAAFQESELLKNIRAMREVEKYAPSEAKQELPQVQSAAKAVIEKTKAEIKKSNLRRL